MTKLIRGLTLHEPWAYAVAHLGKDVENRGFHAADWRYIVGHYIAVHSAVTIKVGEARGAIDHLRVEFGLPIPGTYDPETNKALKWKEAKKAFAFGHIVAVARVADITDDESRCSRWRANYGVGIWLADVVTIEPLACKGYQGLWSLPVPVLREVRVRWAAAGSKK